MIDASDTDICVPGAFISHEFPGSLCIKPKQEIVDCRSLVSDEMRNCIIQLHCMTGCDANYGFYGKGQLMGFEQFSKSPQARWQLPRCGNSLELEGEVLEGLFQFTREVTYNDKMTSNMADAHTFKWKEVRRKSITCLPPDADSLHQHCYHANYLTCSAPSLPEAPPLTSWTQMAAGWWSLSLCSTHTTCSSYTITFARTS